MSHQRKFGTPVVPLTYRDAVAVSPSDSTALTTPCDAVYVGTAGTVQVTTPAGTNTAFTVVAGALLPIAATYVTNTGTNTTAIVALYL